MKKPSTKSITHEGILQIVKYCSDELENVIQQKFKKLEKDHMLLLARCIWLEARCDSLESALVRFAGEQDMDVTSIKIMLEELRQEKYQAHLDHVEDMNPGLAARLDMRELIKVRKYQKA